MSDSESDHYRYSDSGSDSDSSSDSDSDDESSAAAAAPKTTANKVKQAFLARQKARHASKEKFEQHHATEHVLNPSGPNATISDEQKAAIEKRMIKSWFRDSTNVGRWKTKFTTIQAAEALLALDPTNVQKKQDIDFLKGLLADRCQETIKREQERQAAQELRAAQNEYTHLKQQHDLKSLGRARYLKRKYDLKLLKRLAQLNF